MQPNTHPGTWGFGWWRRREIEKNESEDQINVLKSIYGILTAKKLSNEHRQITDAGGLESLPRRVSNLASRWCPTLYSLIPINTLVRFTESRLQGIKVTETALSLSCNGLTARFPTVFLQNALCDCIRTVSWIWQAFSWPKQGCVAVKGKFVHWRDRCWIARSAQSRSQAASFWQTTGSRMSLAKTLETKLVISSDLFASHIDKMLTAVHYFALTAFR